LVTDYIGTVLQPGVNLLETADDFPEDGPLLVITDGQCDALHVRREHAFLVPRGRRLPFNPRGPVFWLDWRSKLRPARLRTG
jgi:hypothetical protein